MSLHEIIRCVAIIAKKINNPPVACWQVTSSITYDVAPAHVIFRWEQWSALAAKPNVMLNLWEHLKSQQTTPTTATIPKRVQVNGELTR